ncbi:MAG: hypothetical protein Fur0042_15600 [Cyanophyceae cyanobacterium]
MALVRQMTIAPLTSIASGMAEFYTPISSHETMLVRVPPQARDDLFVHHFQTDRLMAVRGEFVLVVLQNRRYHYVPLSDRQPAVLTIPPGLPHGAVSFSDEPCLVVNAVHRHGEPCDRDYRPMRPPFPYDLAAARRALAECCLVA